MKLFVVPISRLEDSLIKLRNKQFTIGGKDYYSADDVKEFVYSLYDAYKSLDVSGNRVIFKNK